MLVIPVILVMEKHAPMLTNVLLGESTAARLVRHVLILWVRTHVLVIADILVME